MRNFLFHLYMTVLVLLAFMFMFVGLIGCPVLGWFDEFSLTTQENVTGFSILASLALCALGTIVLTTKSSMDKAW